MCEITTEITSANCILAQLTSRQSITTRINAQTENQKNSTNFRTRWSWRLHSAHSNCKNYDVKRSKMKTEIKSENHKLVQITSRQFHHHTHQRHRPAHATTRTHLVSGLLVGAGIQQQPRAVRVTTASGQNQRRRSALRAPPHVPPTCATASQSYHMPTGNANKFGSSNNSSSKYLDKSNIRYFQ
jgi:hypothetical protein